MSARQRRLDAQRATFEALRAEADAGHIAVPRKLPTSAEMKVEATVRRFGEEKTAWKGALCAAMHRLPGAFSVQFCQRQIKRIDQAIIDARTSALLRDLKF